MKTHFAFFIMLLFSGLAPAQSVFNAELIRKLENPDPSEKIKVFILVKPSTELNATTLAHTTLHYKSGNIYSATSTLTDIKAIGKQKQVIRIEHTAHKLQLMGDTCVVRNRIKGIHNGALPLTQAYDGSGVIVGIIDSGTDFNHPDFKDAAGNSRISYLWDMNKAIAANTPTAFGYGQEWTHTDIDLGLCTHDDLASYGHGTASSGIAAGNGLAINHFAGMAPKADIIVVALDFNDPNHTIADAVQYIFSRAAQMGKPVVINASVGDYDGSHDGTDLEAKIIDTMITHSPGRALVASAGNAGNIAFHVGYSSTPADTNFTWIQGNPTLRLDEYADTMQVKQLSWAVGVNNPAYHDLGRTNFKLYNYALNTLKRDTIYHNAQRIGIVESIADINPYGVYRLNLTIRADSSNFLWRIEHTGTGHIDSWNFDYVTTGLPGNVQYPKMASYKRADTAQTIVSSFQCSKEVIAVANYVNRSQYVDVNNTLQTTTEIAGDIAASSSIGPSRDHKVKPDITASGATILTSAALGLLPNLIANAPQVVAQGGFHITAGGTSASSPVVAGLAALYFQKNPTATNQQLKQAIINCAYNDGFTTANVPNGRWGYGKLDGFSAMTCNTSTAGLYEQGKNADLKVYPNPLTDETTLFFGDNSLKTIKVYTSAGQLVKQDVCSSETYVLKRNNMAPGLYLVLTEAKNEVHKVKILIL
jgi:subtilisin family serine protease